MTFSVDDKAKVPVGNMAVNRLVNLKNKFFDDGGVPLMPDHDIRGSGLLVPCGYMRLESKGQAAVITVDTSSQNEETSVQLGKKTSVETTLPMSAFGNKCFCADTMHHCKYCKRKACNSCSINHEDDRTCLDCVAKNNNVPQCDGGGDQIDKTKKYTDSDLTSLIDENFFNSETQSQEILDDVNGNNESNPLLEVADRVPLPNNDKADGSYQVLIPIGDKEIEMDLSGVLEQDLGSEALENITVSGNVLMSFDASWADESGLNNISLEKVDSELDKMELPPTDTVSDEDSNAGDEDYKIPSNEESESDEDEILPAKKKSKLAKEVIAKEKELDCNKNYQINEKITFDENNRPHIVYPNTGPAYIIIRSNDFCGTTIENHINDLINIIEGDEEMKEKKALLVICDDGADYSIKSHITTHFFGRLFFKLNLGKL